MNDRLKEAFDKIQAEEDLKKHTREYLYQKTNGYKRNKPVFLYRTVVAVMACFLVLLFGWGGYSIYFTTTSSISLDVNPSIELHVNRFDKVISTETYNKDGEMLLSSVNIRFLDYRDALEQILSGESMVKYLTEDQLVVITVIGANEEKSAEMLTSLNACTASYKNVHCSSCNSEEAEEAHRTGMSFGKYKAFLELQALDPDVTAEDVKDLTMHQIRNMINALSGGAKDSDKDRDTDEENCGENVEEESCDRFEEGGGDRSGEVNESGNGCGHGNGRRHGHQR